MRDILDSLFDKELIQMRFHEVADGRLRETLNTVFWSVKLRNSSNGFHEGGH